MRTHEPFSGAIAQSVYVCDVNSMGVDVPPLRMVMISDSWIARTRMPLLFESVKLALRY